MTIKAIETRYKGYRFRSRLEARWAVFFDALGIKWRYEPQGFEKDGVRYLPDFQITIDGHTYSEKNYWVEVKGDRNWLWENNHALVEMHDWGGILPNFCDCGSEADIANGLILLGDIPEPVHGLMFVPIIGHRKGVDLYWRCFTSRQIKQFDQIIGYHLGTHDWFNLENLDREQADFQPKIIKTPYAYPEVTKALAAARSARFEHGETPKVAK